MELFAAVEQLWIARLLKASFYAYPVVNALHIAAIGGLFTSVALIDLRILGAFPWMPEAPFVGLLRGVAFVAFATAALSGLLLFSVRAANYAGMPVFLAKMALIGLAGLNFLLFLVLSRDGRGPLALRLSALLSIVLWAAVLLAGRFIGFL